MFEVIAGYTIKKSYEDLGLKKCCCDKICKRKNTLKDLLLVLKGRIREDELGNEYVTIDSSIGKSSVERTRAGHTPANIIGLRLLMKLGMEVDVNGFLFRNTPEAW